MRSCALGRVSELRQDMITSPDPNSRTNEAALPKASERFQHGPPLLLQDLSILWTELRSPGSTAQWGILSSGAQDDLNLHFISPDSPRWENDFYLTNNFWTCLLSDGIGRLDYGDVLSQGQTFGQYYLANERTPYGHSIKWLRLTPEQYYDEIGKVVEELGLQDQVLEWNNQLKRFNDLTNSLVLAKSQVVTEIRDPIRGSKEFEFNVARPIFRKLMENGFSLVDLA